MLDKAQSTPWPIGTAPKEAFRSESERLVVLASFELETLDGDPELARLARFAARLCDAPSGAVSLVEAERQVFVAEHAMGASETPRSTSMCAHAMLQGDILEVRDCTQDPRFAQFEAVTDERHLRFYAGAPLISAEGAPLGALCVTHTEPRLGGLSDFQREGLAVLAESVKRRIEAHRAASRAVSEIKTAADRLQFMLDSVPDIAWSAAPGPQFDYFNARFTEATGLPARTTIDDWREVIHPEDFEASRVKFGHALETAAFFEDEWRLRQADESYRWVLSRAVPSTDDPATARWFGTLTDIDDRYRISQERELLAGELAHRIKNTFAVITGLIKMRARGDSVKEQFSDDLAANIMGLSRAQDFALRSGKVSPDSLTSLIEILMAPYRLVDRDTFTISGDSVSIRHAAATPLALVFHELATNSVKYGAFSKARGKVAITIESRDDAVTIRWCENGGPAIEDTPAEGFGTRLIEMTISHQLGGTIERDWNEDGLHVALTIPRELLEQQAPA